MDFYIEFSRYVYIQIKIVQKYCSLPGKIKERERKEGTEAIYNI